MNIERPESAGAARTEAPLETARPTYYGLPQLKPAPFKPYAVGGYVFLAGISGGAALLAALLAARNGPYGRHPIRHADALSLLAPTVGTGLLVWDLYTPHRFYNMLRIFRPTSGMSIGSWLLAGFGATATTAAAAEALSCRPRWRRLRSLGNWLRLPAALTGMGIGTYTASLFAGTSTPHWAAAPKSLGVQFGASSVATAASALSFAERDARLRRSLDTVTCCALAIETAATLSARSARRDAGVEKGPMVKARDLLGIALPLGLLAASLIGPPTRRRRALSRAAAAAVLGGSLAMRVRTIQEGLETASDPEITLRFARGGQPAPKRLPPYRRSDLTPRRP